MSEPVDLEISRPASARAVHSPQPRPRSTPPTTTRRSSQQQQNNNNSTNNSTLPQLAHFHDTNFPPQDDARAAFEPFASATRPGGLLHSSPSVGPPSPSRPTPQIPPQLPPQTPPHSIYDSSSFAQTSSSPGNAAVALPGRTLAGLGALAGIRRGVERTERERSEGAAASGSGSHSRSQEHTSSPRAGASFQGGGENGYYSSMGDGRGVSAGANFVSRDDYLSYRDRGGGHTTLLRPPKNHLPPLGPDHAGLTAFPISEVKKDIEFSIMALLSPKLFTSLMEDPLARHRFREFLTMTDEGTETFDAWLDIRSLCVKVETAEMSAAAIQDLYLAPSSPLTLPLSEEDKESLREGTALACQLGASLEGPQKRLLETLYNGAFQQFLKYKMIEVASVRLGRFDMTDEEREGLGDCICLTNPRLPDHPLVLISTGFEKLSGYTTKSILGRNCRFLQGPGTSPAAVERIRHALNAGETATNLLLNYKRSGEAFFNLLCLIPLRDSTGSVGYFLGGQVNVTGFLSSAKGLEFLVGGGHDEIENLPPSAASAQSPAMAAYSSTLMANTINSKTYPLKHIPTIRKAAGEAVDAGYSQARLPFSVPDKQPSNNSSGSHLQKMAQLLGIKEKKSLAKQFEEGELHSKQKIIGAEGTLDQKGGGVESQIDSFSNTYTRAIVVRKDSRTVIFATEPYLRFVGLPTKTPENLYNPKILHRDLLDMVTGAEKESTAALSGTLKVVFRSGRSYSTPCGIKSQAKGSVLSANANAEVIKFTTIHLTPIRNSDNIAEAFVVIVG